MQPAAIHAPSTCSLLLLTQLLAVSITLLAFRSPWLWCACD
jgi:hypothetical protein